MDTQHPIGCPPKWPDVCYKCGDRHKADDCIFVPSIENTVTLKRRTDLNEPVPTKKFALMVSAGCI